MSQTRYLLAAIAACFLAGTAEAQITESGDSGQTIGTAQNGATGTSNSPISTISGTIGTHDDADLYRIYISSPSTFSASVTTVSALYGPGQLDTGLFLFNAAGIALGANDDADGFSVESNLPAGDGAYAGLNPGFYFLGISLFGNEPVNSANQLLFVREDGSNQYSVRREASGINPRTLFDFDNNPYSGDDDTGSYTINLAGVAAGPAAVPEPATWAMMLAGFAAAGVALRQRRAERPALA